MAFKKYLHVERLGKEDVDGILNGICYIQSKIDGTNACVWIENCEIKAGSRTRELSFENDNAGFYNWMCENGDEQNKIKALLRDYPNYIIYGEWMGTNKFVGAIKDYDEQAKKVLWIFDVYDTGMEKYLCDEVWRKVLKKYDLTDYFVALLDVIENPTQEQLLDIANKNNFLLKNANHAGEGIVIKNYDYINKYGHFAMAKIVLDEYIQTQKKKNKKEIAPGDTEQEIVERWVLDSELSKAKAKACVACNSDNFDIKSGKMIGMYLNTVFNDAIVDELGDILKKMKYPTINFAQLKSLVFIKARKYIGLM